MNRRTFAAASLVPALGAASAATAADADAARAGFRYRIAWKYEAGRDAVSSYGDHYGTLAEAIRERDRCLTAFREARGPVYDHFPDAVVEIQEIRVISRTRVRSLP